MEQRTKIRTSTQQTGDNLAGMEVCHSGDPPLGLGDAVVAAGRAIEWSGPSLCMGSVRAEEQKGIPSVDGHSSRKGNCYIS
jgi:hypothetical protein